ncbi:olfactory receptor 5B21-like [Rhinatrema bivittatum]|uniref:olfactory receptor 5B21-like n=1 Tax=Rhinatrema bivittatum TaxID=194408 RepID=UPI00112D85D0|nr:olfactory receptor 5B21-like [Rhinatrema bivittatum]
MEGWNQTSVTEFILLGLTDDPNLQIPLYLLFSLIYIITLLGNIGIIVITRLDVNLQTPMYFFLCHLSLVDICYSSAVVPKTLQVLLAEQKSISFLGCALQLYFLAAACTIEGHLLVIMAYDRYVAICNPLIYLVVMKRKVCARLLTVAYMGGFVISLIHTMFTFHLSFCGSNVINHFFCQAPPLLVISCSNTSINELVIFIILIFNGIPSVLIILISYIYILVTILKIRSAEGRRKAFSTCASHLTTVLIFYVTIISMYLRPSSSYSVEQDRVASVFYTMVIPMLNPLIYSLRNKEVKAVLRKIIKSYSKLVTNYFQFMKCSQTVCLNHFHSELLR